MNSSATSKQKGIQGIGLPLLAVSSLFIAASSLPAQTGDAASTRSNAIALEQKGLNADAERIWSSISTTDPQNAEAFAHLGLLEARQDHYAPAIDYYKKALAINPKLPGVQMNLGLASFKAGQFPDAIRSFSIELKSHPGDQRLTILLGMAHYGMGDYLVAIPYLQQAASRDPQNLPIRLTLAHSCLWSKQYECVLDVYKEILALNAESAEADMLAGEALDEKQDSPGAIQQFRAAAIANPKEPNVHFGLGYLLWTQNEYAEAATEFQQELNNDSHHALARAYLADVWVQLNEFDKALSDLEKATAADSSNAMVHRDLGIVYTETNRKDDALRELKRSIDLDSKDVTTHWRLARLYQSMGKKDEAKLEFDLANKMTKESHPTVHQQVDSPQPPAH